MSMTPDGIARPRLAQGVDRAFWIPEAAGSVPAAFRADVTIHAATTVAVMLQAARSFRLWVDGEPVASGPLRFAPSVPEVHTERLRLAPGTHALAVQAGSGGVTDRITPSLPSFLWTVVTGGDDDSEIAVSWWGRALTEYADTGLRISPLLDRLEWLDRPLDPSWRTAAPSPDDGWAPVVPVEGLSPVLGRPTRGVIDLPRWPVVAPAEVARGRYRETFTGYRFDDPTVQFMLADPAPPEHADADGIWARYDLGRVRIGTLELTVDTDRPAEVTLGYADRLDPHGRVAPVTALSTGPTRMIQHVAVRAGTTRVEPVGALGGRWVEVRVRTTGSAAIRDVGFRDRDFLGDPVGSFRCGDPLLEWIWAVGLDTTRSCAEDALVDSTRERGEWLGDTAAAGIDLLAVGWGDLRLVHRALLHAAASARDDGLVGGCVPGTPIHLVGYAAQWLTACLRVAEYDPVSPVLAELEGAGRRNATTLLVLAEAMVAPGSVERPHTFVDWGYSVPPGRPDVATLLMIVRGLWSWTRWQLLLGRPAEAEFAERCARLAERVRTLVDPADYHAVTLAALIGLVPASVAAPAITARLHGGFPLNPDGPRLRDPGRADPAVITPYFTNFSVPVLIEAGRTDVALDLWRRAWGWMLDQGATTWWEVFDDRWSHGHFWSGAPTWQLTRHVLGARVSAHEGRRVLHLAASPGPLEHCAGTVPIGPNQSVDVSWTRDGDRLECTVTGDDETLLMAADGIRKLPAGTTTLHLHSPDGIRYVS